MTKKKAERYGRGEKPKRTEKAKTKRRAPQGEFHGRKNIGKVFAPAWATSPLSFADFVQIVIAEGARKHPCDGDICKEDWGAVAISVFSILEASSDAYELWNHRQKKRQLRKADSRESPDATDQVTWRSLRSNFRKGVSQTALLEGVYEGLETEKKPAPKYTADQVVQLIGFSNKVEPPSNILRKLIGDWRAREYTSQFAYEICETVPDSDGRNGGRPIKRPLPCTKFQIGPRAVIVDHSDFDKILTDANRIDSITVNEVAVLRLLYLNYPKASLNAGRRPKSNRMAK